MSALAPQLGGKQTSGEQAENDANDPTVWTGRVLQAESSERQWLVLRFCIRPLRGADRSWPLWISARGNPALRFWKWTMPPVFLNRRHGFSLGLVSLLFDGELSRSRPLAGPVHHLALQGDRIARGEQQVAVPLAVPPVTCP